MRIVIATTNKGKLKEISAILKDICNQPIDFIDLIDAGLENFDYEETGKTFSENAAGKAVVVSQKTGLPAIADDSGLCVDALDGAPGIKSARWAGVLATDRDRNTALLSLLTDIPEKNRTAYFICAASLALPDGKYNVTEGTCHGLISSKPKGEHGFGYDPIFYIPEYERTLAELAPDTKNAISHRRKAFTLLSEYINRL